MRRSRPVAPAVLTAWQLASGLLAYPDDDLVGRLPLMARAGQRLPDRLRAPLAPLVADLEQACGTAAGLLDAQARYVETFDMRNRRSLFLTWWTTGDTRNRGSAMVRFVQTYRAAGTGPPAAELPDHLAVVLEFAATVDPAAGRALLIDHVTALTSLHKSLDDLGTVYSGVVAAVLATLPPPDADGLREARRLVLAGPPVEAVGLDAYPTPTFTGGAR